MVVTIKTTKQNKNMNETSTVDPMDIPASEADLSFPRVVPSNYEVIIDKCVKAPNKAGTGDNLELHFKTVKEAKDTRGDIVPAGFPLRMYIGLTPTDKRAQSNIIKDCQRLLKAAGCSDATARALLDSPSMIDGKTILVKVSIRRETANFPESNNVNSIVLEG